jgi:hypothetical protein
MGLAKRQIGGLLITGVAMLAAPPSASTEERVGVVTNLEGVALVTRVALPEPRPLQFKDDVYVRDRISTGERSIVRVLLGGKATVTARERSVLTITESPGVATIDLSAGRISVAVSKGLMKRGEVVEIKTPNAVSAIRGTIVVAEVFPDENLRSTISVLRGLVDVTRLDKGRRVGPSVDVGALQSITVVGLNPLTHPSAITAGEAKRLTSEFQIIPRNVPSAATVPAVQHAMQRAMDDAAAVAAAGGPARRTAETTAAHEDSGTVVARGDGTDSHNGDGKGKDKESGNANAKGKGQGNGNADLSTAGASVDVLLLSAPPVAPVDTSVSVGTSKKSGKK